MILERASIGLPPAFALKTPVADKRRINSNSFVRTSLSASIARPKNRICKESR